MTNLLDFSEYKGTNRTGEDGWIDEMELLGWVTKCPFCNVGLTEAFYPNEPNDFRSHNEGEISKLRVEACGRCGWWELEKTYVLITSGSGRFYTLKSGTLRSYPESAKDIPIATLRNYIYDHPDKIWGINPSAMEKLVGSVLKDFFNCEVVHVGKSHDGGVDLLVVHSDFTMPIQVKRRSRQDKTESVKVVRELFGVLFRDGYRDAAVVTTAKSFTREAKREVDLVLKEGKCDRFDLIDCNKFIELIDATADEVLPSWRSLLGRGDEVTERLLADGRYREFRRIVAESRG